MKYSTIDAFRIWDLVSEDKTVSERICSDEEAVSVGVSLNNHPPG